jgi:hypothetical protein
MFGLIWGLDRDIGHPGSTQMDPRLVEEPCGFGSNSGGNIPSDAGWNGPFDLMGRARPTCTPFCSILQGWLASSGGNGGSGHGWARGWGGGRGCARGGGGYLLLTVRKCHPFHPSAPFQQKKMGSTQPLSQTWDRFNPIQKTGLDPTQLTWVPEPNTWLSYLRGPNNVASARYFPRDILNNINLLNSQKIRKIRPSI